MHPATEAEGEAFFAERFPSAAAAADPDHRLYEPFGLARGSLAQLAGPSVWVGAVKSILSGVTGGKPTGDVRVLAGQFVAKDGDLLYAHRAKHAAEEGDWDTILAAAKRAG